MATNEVPQEKALSISKIEGSSMIFNLENLKEILCSPEVIDKKVAVVSVTGDQRSGKSLVLNYIMRYLRERGFGQWFGQPDEKLVGFEWSGGLEKITKGVWAWNKLFPLEWVGNQEIHVMLIDSEENAKNHLKDRRSTFYQHTTTYLLPRIDDLADGLKNYDGRNSELGHPFISHYKKCIENWFDSTHLKQKKTADLYFTCGDLFAYCERVNQLARERGGIENLSIVEADLLFYYTRKREEYYQYYTTAIRGRLEHVLSSISDMDTFHEKLKAQVMGEFDALVMSLKTLSSQREQLEHQINHLYLFLRKEAEHLIAMREIRNDSILSTQVFTQFQENIRRQMIMKSNPVAVLNLLKQERDDAIKKLQVELKNVGTFRDALFNGMEAKIAAYGSEVYGPNDEKNDFYEIWRDQDGRKILKADELLQQKIQPDYNIKPNKFCDDINHTLMDDPVRLPFSKKVVDRCTILQHFLLHLTDPFNRTPLKVEQLIPLPKLKERIEMWKFERELHRREHGNPI